MSSLANFYFNQIEEAQDLDQLQYLIEDAANKIKSDREYFELVNKAQTKAEKWSESLR